MKHFEFYPRIEYSGHTAINMLVRAKIRDLVLDESSVYYEYTIRDSDRADIISTKYYGNPSYTWAIFYANEIQNPLTEWPRDHYSFNEFIRRRYGSVERAQTTIHHYLLDGEYIIDETTYLDNSIDFDRKATISIYDYESDLNEARREIKVLDVVYLRQINEELRHIFE